MILHRDEVLPFVLADVVDRTDIGMIEGRSRLCLALESLQSMVVSGQLFGEELQSDGAL